MLYVLPLRLPEQRSTLRVRTVLWITHELRVKEGSVNSSPSILLFLTTIIIVTLHYPSQHNTVVDYRNSNLTSYTGWLKKSCSFFCVKNYSYIHRTCWNDPPPSVAHAITHCCLFDALPRKRLWEILANGYLAVRFLTYSGFIFRAKKSWPWRWFYEHPKRR